MSPKNAFEEQTSNRDVLGLDEVELPHTREQKRPPTVIVWKNVAIFAYLHIAALYGLFLVPSASYQTLIWTVILYILAAIGVTAGAHRLWAHRSYKAGFTLRAFLAMCNCISFQNSIFEWARDHRVHHKFSETDADPHNAKRGFFFAHIGWLLVKKHPDVKERGKGVDVSDLRADPVVAFQARHFLPLGAAFNLILPTVVPVLGWGENPLVALMVAGALRYILVLNATWLVNSAAHMWGNKPYDVRINPSQNPIVAFLAAGEGFHNYHHTFPHDYSTSEFGVFLNLTTMFIDAMSFVGLAFDRKTIPMEVIMKRKARTGEGSAEDKLMNEKSPKVENEKSPKAENEKSL